MISDTPRVAPRVPFGRTFSKPPAVTFAITWLDVDKDYNLRYNVEITEITTEEFTVSFKTWCDTYIYSIKVTYWAFGVSPKVDVCCVMVTCRGARAWRRLQLLK